MRDVDGAVELEVVSRGSRIEMHGAPENVRRKWDGGTHRETRQRYSAPETAHLTTWWLRGTGEPSPAREVERRIGGATEEQDSGEDFDGQYTVDRSREVVSMTKEGFLPEDRFPELL
jgi:hypothetical protein